MKKIILYFLPFIIFIFFFLFIIIIDGVNVNIGLSLLLVTMLLLCCLGFLSKNKILNIIGIIFLLIISVILIIEGIQNDYFILAEAKLAVVLLLYYLILFVIEKRKDLIIMSLIINLILLILFFPIKVKYKDGGTTDYKALAYRVIKWNRLLDDDNYYIDTDIYWFPKNIHSFEYYTPIELPNIIASYNNKEIDCNKGSSHWSKVVDGDNITQINDSIDPLFMNYTDNLVITNNYEVIVDTVYNISDVEYAEYTEDLSVLPYNKLNFNNETKNINLNNLNNGIYIINFKITNNKDYAYYSFKVKIKK